MEWGSTLHSVVGRFLSLDLALGNDILLNTILVAFLEATAQQLKPIQPPVVITLGGITALNG